MEPTSVEKIHKADDHIGIASAGHVADARQLIDFARRQAQVNRLRYSEPIGVEALTKMVVDNIQQYTQVGGARPFGVALIVGGIEDGEPRLYETDPSGTPYEWKALAVGGNRSEIEDYLKDHYTEEMDLDAGVGLALSALASVNEEGLRPGGIGVATVDAESEQYRELTEEEIESHLTEHDLLAEEPSGEPGGSEE
jgi:proteasome alpha subunit